MEFFKYLGSMITNDARCTHENSIQDCHGKSSTQQEEDSLHQQIRLKFKEENGKVLHLERSFILCWNLNTSESRSEIPGKIWNVVLERMEKISWTDRVRNEDVTHRVKEERNILLTTKEGKLTGLVKSCVGTAFWNTFLKVRWREGWTWREDEEEEVSSSWMILKRNERIERGRATSHCVENSLWKSVWTCHTTEWEMKEWKFVRKWVAV